MAIIFKVPFVFTCLILFYVTREVHRFPRMSPNIVAIPRFLLRESQKCLSMPFLHADRTISNNCTSLFLASFIPPSLLSKYWKRKEFISLFVGILRHIFYSLINTVILQYIYRAVMFYILSLVFYIFLFIHTFYFNERLRSKMLHG